MNKNTLIKFGLNANGFQVTCDTLKLSEALEYLDYELNVEDFLTWDEAKQKSSLKQLAEILLEDYICLEYYYTVES